MDFNPIDWKVYNKPPYFPQYLSRGDTKKLVSYDDGQLVELDRCIDKMSDQYDLDRAKGIFLDRLGKLKDEPRNGNNDDLYRLMIRLRILLDTANGSIPDIIKVIKFLYGSEIVHIVPNYPAAIIIMHDGETAPVNFNSIITQVIGAGIGYETRELFYFNESFHSAEWHDVMVRSDFSESFGDPVYHNGRMLRDGHTIRDIQAVPFMRNGRFARNGEMTRIPYYWKQAYGPVRLPPLYGSGIRDSLRYSVNLGNCAEGFRARLFRNGTIRRGGGELHRGTGNGPAYDTMRTGIRKHHFHNGVYSRNGTIKYDGMALIPVE